MKIGANYLNNDTCEFIVWAPLVKEMAVQIEGEKERLIPMIQDELGYWRVTATEISPGTLYQYQLDGGQKNRPD